MSYIFTYRFTRAILLYSFIFLSLAAHESEKERDKSDKAARQSVAGMVVLATVCVGGGFYWYHYYNRATSVATLLPIIVEAPEIKDSAVPTIIKEVPSIMENFIKLEDAPAVPHKFTHLAHPQLLGISTQFAQYLSPLIRLFKQSKSKTGFTKITDYDQYNSYTTSVSSDSMYPFIKQILALYSPDTEKAIILFLTDVASARRIIRELTIRNSNDKCPPEYDFIIRTAQRNFQTLFEELTELTSLIFIFQSRLVDEYVKENSELTIA